MALQELHSLRTSIRLRPRYAETDQMGVVYHANYLIWFHEARDAMLAALGVDICAIDESGFAFPVAESHCFHRAPARYGEEVLIAAAPVIDDGQTFSIARLRVRYWVQSARSKQILAEGETVNVMTDQTGRLLLRLPACFEPMICRLNEARNRSFES